VESTDRIDVQLLLWVTQHWVTERVEFNDPHDDTVRDISGGGCRSLLVLLVPEVRVKPEVLLVPEVRVQLEVPVRRSVPEIRLEFVAEVHTLNRRCLWNGSE